MEEVASRFKVQTTVRVLHFQLEWIKAGRAILLQGHPPKKKSLGHQATIHKIDRCLVSCPMYRATHTYGMYDVHIVQASVCLWRRRWKTYASQMLWLPIKASITGRGRKEERRKRKIDFPSSFHYPSHVLHLLLPAPFSSISHFPFSTDSSLSFLWSCIDCERKTEVVTTRFFFH